MSDNESTQSPAIQLDAIEARVLGSLVEKAATTPDVYPLTLNAVVLACNQKSNRHPVMKLDPGRVGQALRELEKKGLVRRESAARAERYAHTATRGLALSPTQLAVLSVMLLRGPQTLNELLVRTERLARFDGAEPLSELLDGMSTSEPAYVVRLPRGSGQREDRYMHLLSGQPDEAATSARSAAPTAVWSPQPEDTLAERVARLEDRLAELEEELQQLKGNAA